MPLERLLITTPSQSKVSWAEAVTEAVRIAQLATPPIIDLVLVVHDKKVLGGTLQSYIGAAEAKALAANEKISLVGGAVPASAGLMLRAETLGTVGTLHAPAVVIAFFADERMLDQVDGLLENGGVVVVPDHPNDAAEWDRRWSPNIPGQPPRSLQPLIADPKVEKALKSLSPRINRIQSSFGALDHEDVETTLRVLRAKNHNEPPQNLKSWAIRDGWTPRLADELAKAAGRIFSLKTKPSIASIENGQARYDSWV